MFDLDEDKFNGLKNLKKRNDIILSCVDLWGIKPLFRSNGFC